MPVDMLAGQASARPNTMPVPGEAVPRRPVQQAPGRRALLNARSLALLLPLAVYLVAGALLAFRYESFHPDAQNRVANAYYVLFSRDPHLAAIGFVWNPLPSLAVLPLLPLTFLWPALTERAFAGNIASALFMAGAVHQLHAILADFEVPTTPRAVLTVLFAAHPMTLYYGANGMTEAQFLLALLLTCRYLARWLDRSDLQALMISGMGLALAYLTRQEALAAALSTTALVLVVASTRRRPARWSSGLAHAAVFVAPCAASVAALAAISWVIVGHPFQQFSSLYGNASQIEVLGVLGSENLAKSNAGFAFQQITALAPLLVVAAVMGLAAGAWWRDLRILAPLATLGGVLTFAVAAFLAGQTIGWTRYFVTAVPLTVLLAGAALITPRRDPWRGDRGRQRQPAPARLMALVAAVAILVVAPGIITAKRAMLDPAVDPEDYAHLSFVVGSGRPLTETAEAKRHQYTQTRAIARRLDDLRLPNGSIVLDTFNTCGPLVLASRRPKQFVITSDRDFERVLAFPTTFNATHLMVPEPGGYGDLDAVNRAYPTLYENGAGIATLAHEFKGPGCPTFRLYRLNPAPPRG